MYSTLLPIAAGLSGALVAALPTGGFGGNNDTDSACGGISTAFRQAAARNATGNLYLPGDLAHECLQSMPFDAERGSLFVLELQKYLEWQSTLEVLKDPPSGYLSPPTDIRGSLNDVYEKAINNKFRSQFEFDESINRIFQSANDGHLSILLCSQAIFSFSNEFPIVSVSTDGVSEPKLYELGDAKLLASGVSGLDIHPIVSINNQSAESYLQYLGGFQPYQDPDAQYNAMFGSTARQAVLGTTEGAWNINQGGQGPGQGEIIFTFGNGTTRHVTTTAKVNLDGFNYQDGLSLFEDICVPYSQSTSSSESSSESSSSSPSNSAPVMYPQPVVRDDYNLISSYYLNETDLDDVAVMFIPSFDTSSPGAASAFAEHATDIVDKALAVGKSKLVIDLSANGGGTITSRLDLFQLFFPEEKIVSRTRFRSHKSIDLIGQAIASLPPNNEVFDTAESLGLAGFVSPNQSYAFESWDEVYGPYEQLGAPLTNLVAGFNLSAVSTPETPVRGYGGVENNRTTAPFAAEDILLVTDGFCTSTCTIFAELMKNQAGVKSLVFGGRPQRGPMQAIGGSKGCQSLESSVITKLVSGAQLIAAQTANTTNPALSPQQVAWLKESSPSAEMPLEIGGLNVNFRNAYLPPAIAKEEGVDGEVPIQFVYEPADCRLFYTYDNLAHPETSWVAAARAFWGGGVCGGVDASRSRIDVRQGEFMLRGL